MVVKGVLSAATDALRRQEAPAFEELVRANIGRLRGTARRLLRSESEADDAVQEAFIQAYQALPNFRGDASPATWLHRIVVNTSLMRLRRRRPESLGDVDELQPRFAANGHLADPGIRWNDAEDLERLAERKETRDRVRRIIENLPEIHRTVLVLRDIEEMSTKETAELLDIGPSAVKTRLHRARLALKVRLEADLDDVARTEGAA